MTFSSAKYPAVARKISLPPGFDPWTVQPVGSRYTDYATRPTLTEITSSYSHSSYLCTGIVNL